MCLMLWVAAEQPIPEVTLVNPQTPDPVSGYHRIEDVAPDARVRARFTLPCVSYVGSHEGCGCGYNSGSIGWEGFARVDEVTSLFGALLDEERTAFLVEQGSRERLRALVERALVWGAVEVFGCWAGDEVDPTVAVEEVNAEHFSVMTEPIAERVLYRVRRL